MEIFARKYCRRRPHAPACETRSSATVAAHGRGDGILLDGSGSPDTIEGMGNTNLTKELTKSKKVGSDTMLNLEDGMAWRVENNSHPPSSKFTYKSDVYSFGVVLVEFLTRQKLISFEANADEDCSLIMRFLLSMEENLIMEILDVEVSEHGKKEDVMAITLLAHKTRDKLLDLASLIGHIAPLLVHQVSAS
nr:wall-associated receptor kinase-like 8 [Ipomoea batatas]